MCITRLVEEINTESELLNLTMKNKLIYLQYSDLSKQKGTNLVVIRMNNATSAYMFL